MLISKVCKIQSGEVVATNVRRSVNLELIIILNDSLNIYEMKFLLHVIGGSNRKIGRKYMSNFLVDDANHGKYKKHIT